MLKRRKYNFSSWRRNYFIGTRIIHACSNMYINILKKKEENGKRE